MKSKPLESSVQPARQEGVTSKIKYIWRAYKMQTLPGWGPWTQCRCLGFPLRRHVPSISSRWSESNNYLKEHKNKFL